MKPNRFMECRAAGGKPILRQLIEAATLRLAKEPLGISEYVDYGLWHKDVQPPQLREFIGWRTSYILDRMLNSDSARELANDKLLTSLVLKSLGFPIPEEIATYSIAGRHIGSEVRLGTIPEVRRLLDRDVYPFFVKPIAAGYGRGVLGVSRRDGSELQLMNGEKIEIDAFLEPFAFEPYRGMLFQRPLVAHPTIRDLTGSQAISCVRFICFLTKKGPSIHTAFWKVTVGQNMLDNFSHGDYGNLLAGISLEDGRVLRAIQRLGPGGEIETHPTTKKRLAGFQLPLWNEAIDLVRSAAVHFPGLRLQNWDVALCPKGPVLVELNSESELAVPQGITRRGMRDERLRQLLTEIAREDLHHAQAVKRGRP